jgi:hypothetical protein
MAAVYRWFVLVSLALVSGGLGAAPVAGQVENFPVSTDLVEQCVRITAFPLAIYSEQDLDQEKFYCELDFSQLALCPKIWSTSPGTILYKIDKDAYGDDYRRFEQQHCAEGFHAGEAALTEPAMYKVSINARDTSATFAPASWVYYHMSRYFQTGVQVPVAVYRSMGAKIHNERVTKPALDIVAGRHGLGMLTAGWRLLDAIETGQSTGAQANAVLTDNGQQIFGVLLNIKGDRYGPEINGTRESGWGSGQNNDFQQTAPFIALRSELPVAEAASAAIHEARRNPKMAKALPADIPLEQVVFWMQDILEITLLDFILGQQDRIGNIDFNWRWYWVEDGTLHSSPAQGKEPPGAIAAHKPLRLKQSALNDNDAGVRSGYADFAAKTHMLENLRHYNTGLYQRLGRLAADFKASGAAYQWLTESAGLSSKEAETIIRRTGEAFSLLQADCQRGRLQLDLEPKQFLITPGAGTTDTKASCTINAP